MKTRKPNFYDNRRRRTLAKDAERKVKDEQTKRNARREAMLEAYRRTDANQSI